MQHCTLIFLFFLLTTTTLSFGQGENWRERGGSRVQMTIKGKVIDGENGEPLEYAAVTLYAVKDSAMVTGSITNPDGTFEIQTRPGNFYATIEYISYTKRTIENIRFERGKTEYDLGNLGLGADAFTLSEVEVRAEKSQLQMGLDKKVFNVGKDLANQGGNAEDILNNVPSVSVDIEGNVSLRGNDGVRILVDGRPSGLIGSGSNNGLSSLPANLIDKVEVITNPSARYEAEGMAGIINIVLKKDKKGGLNGSFDLTAGVPDTYGASANMNYRKKDFNFFLNYGVNFRTRPGRGNLYQESIGKDNSTRILEVDREHDRSRFSNSIRAGSDWYINEKNTLTGAIIFRYTDQDNFADIEYRDYLESINNPTAITLRTDDEIGYEPDLQYSLQYKREFDRKGQVLTADIRFEGEDETERSQYAERYFDPNLNPLGIPDLQQRSANKEHVSELQFQADYVHPFGEEGRFEVGVRTSRRNIRNNYAVEEFADGIWTPEITLGDTVVNLSNNFDYEEGIYALYTTFGNKYNRFSYSVGLRLEHTDIKTELIETSEVNDRSFTNLFPSIFLNYEFPGNNALQVSYSRRIQRPRFWFLNPFFTFSDSRNFFSGNPNLDPVFSNQVEVGHIKYFSKGSISTSVYYRHAEGVYQRIRSVDDNGNSNTRPENLSNENAYGLEVTFSLNPVKAWRLDGDFNFFRSMIDGGNLGEQFEADAITWFSRLNNRITVMKDLDVQLRANYRAPRETTQGRTKGIFSMDLGISKDIMNKNGTITLSVRDLFNSRIRRYITEGENFYSEGEFQWRARTATLTFSYRLNQKKKRQRGRGYEGGDEGFMFGR